MSPYGIELKKVNNDLEISLNYHIFIIINPIIFWCLYVRMNFFPFIYTYRFALRMNEIAAINPH